MATIKKYKKKNGDTAYMFNAYVGIDPETGKKRRTTRRGFSTQKEAKLALARIELGVDEPKSKTDKTKPVENNYNTFEDVYYAWFAQYKNTVKPNTSVYTESHFENHILPVFGNMRIDGISLEFCQNAVNSWSEDSKSFKCYKAYTKTVMDHARRLKLISENPMDLVIVPKKTEFIEDESLKFYDKNELKEFLEWVEKSRPFQDYVIFRTLAYTGLRKSELLVLTWKDIDFGNKQISISKTFAYGKSGRYISSTKTKKSNRILSIDDTTITLLKKLKLEQKKNLFSCGKVVKKDSDQLVFLAKNFKPIAHSYLNKAMKLYPGKNIPPHGLRHTHASLLFESGVSVKGVQQRLGHSNIKTTMDIYTHLTRSSEKEVADTFSEYMSM